MRFSVERTAFSEAWRLVGLVVPKRHPRQIFTSVKVEVRAESIDLLASDGELRIRVGVPDIGDIIAPGDALLPWRSVSGMVAESQSPRISMDADGKDAMVFGDGWECTYAMTDAPAEFPAIPAFAEAGHLCLSLRAEAFRELIQRTVFAADPESSRYALGGTCLEVKGEEVNAIATDGRRLAWQQAVHAINNGQPNGEFVVPLRALRLLRDVLPDNDASVLLAMRDGQFYARQGFVSISAPLVEGRFPKWRDVIPDRAGRHCASVEVGPLRAAVHQVRCVTEEGYGPAFAFSGSALKVSSRGDVPQLRVTVPIAYAGPDMEVLLDPWYVAEFLDVLDSHRRVDICIGAVTAPAYLAGKDAADTPVFFDAGDGYSYTLMPLGPG